MSPLRVPTSSDEPPARRAGPPRVLLVRTGQARAETRAHHGDYTDWFQAVLHPLGVRTEAVAVFQGEVLPYGGRYDGILLTGSPQSVRDKAPWMAMLGRWALAMSAHTPVLGVCFGHQLLGEALGGRVQRHPAGPEWGTVEVALTEAGRADPLFAGLPPTLQVQALHEDAVLRPPPTARVLAGNAHTPLQAFAHGPWLRAVQFHPEATAALVQAVLGHDGVPPTTPIADSPHGAAILANWVAGFVRRAEGGAGA